MEQGVSDGPLWTLSLAKGSSNVVWLAIESAQSASSRMPFGPVTGVSSTGINGPL